MQVQVGMVVRATAGKEQDGFYVVTRLEDGFVWLADGKHRTLEKPKRKNMRHIRPTRHVWELDGMTDRALRRKLRDTLQGGN